MAVYTGISGSVALAGGYNLHIKSFTLRIVSAEHDVTAFGSDGWKEWIAGLKEWSGSFEGWQDTVVAIQLPGQVAAALTLTAYTGKTFSGNAFVQQVEPAVDVAGVGSVSFTFRGTGILAIL